MPILPDDVDLRAWQPASVPAGTYRREAGDQVQATALPGACTEGPAGAVRRGDDARPARRTSAPCPRNPPAAAAAAPSQTVLDEAGGIHVSPETARRMACDAATVEMQHGPGGEILKVGRGTRTISPALRRALAARDRQCRFPGCQNRRCDAHHLEHWADGGATALDNLVLLCRHHRAAHEDGFRATLDAQGNVQFARPDGPPAPGGAAGAGLDGRAARTRDGAAHSGRHRNRPPHGNPGLAG